MKASLSNFNTENLFSTVGRQLGVPVSDGFKQSEITLPEKFGEGHISSYKFQDDLTLFLFRATLRQTWEWEFHSNDSSPLYILFLLEGSVEDHQHEKQEYFTLRPLETFMVVHPAGPRRSIVFPAAGAITLAVLRVSQDNYLRSRGMKPEDLPENIQQLFSPANLGMQHLYPPSRSSIDAALLINDIFQCRMTGLFRSCFIEGKARELLSLQLQRTLDAGGWEIDAPSCGIEQIKAARDILIGDLKNAPTIDVLAKKAGLNRQKLKQDFKKVFGKTIFQYLREERMKAARHLLMARQTLSVRQVAEMVGYENVSHFSKRFREQHGVLPSELREVPWQKGEEN